MRGAIRVRRASGEVVTKLPLRHAADLERYDIFHMLLSRGAHPVHGALVRCARLGRTKEVKGLIHAGANVNARFEKTGMTALHYAATVRGTAGKESRLCLARTLVSAA